MNNELYFSEKVNKLINQSDIHDSVLIDVIKSMQKLLVHDGNYFNDHILIIDVKILPPALALCFLRHTFPFRNKLSNWKPFRDSFHIELSGRGLNADKILFGLYQ